MKGDTPPMLMYGVVVAVIFILILAIAVMALLSATTGRPPV